MTIDAVTQKRLLIMAQAAKVRGDNHWGDETQIIAFNAFNTAASRFMTEIQNERWDVYSMKATNDEIVDEALRMLGLID